MAVTVLVLVLVAVAVIEIVSVVVVVHVLVGACSPVWAARCHAVNTWRMGSRCKQS